jgi:hypothetical protein
MNLLFVDRTSHLTLRALEWHSKSQTDMSEDFLADESWKVLHGKKRVFACLLVFFGAFLMSLVGAWA